MVTTNNNNQIKKETASVKYYFQNKKGRKYTTKRINLDAKSQFADAEKVIVINEDDFKAYYEKSASLDDFITSPANEDAIAGLEDLQKDYNDALKKIALLEKEYNAELREIERRLSIEKSNHNETKANLEKAIAINTANHTAYITALDNVSLESEKAIKSAINDAVKQTTIYNNNEFANLSLIKRIKKEKLTAPAVEDDKEIFEPAIAVIQKAINFYRFDKLE